MRSPHRAGPLPAPAPVAKGPGQAPEVLVWDPQGCTISAEPPGTPGPYRGVLGRGLYCSAHQPRSHRSSCQHQRISLALPGAALSLMDANVSPSPFVFIWCQPAARGDAARAGHAALPPTPHRSRHGSAQPSTNTGILVPPKPASDAQPMPRVHPREHPRSLCRHWGASLRPQQGWGDPRVTPPPPRSLHLSVLRCLLIHHPVSPCQHQWDFALGLSWGVGNMEPLWARLLGHGVWGGTGWPRGSVSSPQSPMVTHGHPSSLVSPRWLHARGTATLPPRPDRFQDGASPLELPVGNF